MLNDFWIRVIFLFLLIANSTISGIAIHMSWLENKQHAVAMVLFQFSMFVIGCVMGKALSDRRANT